MAFWKMTVRCPRELYHVYDGGPYGYSVACMPEVEEVDMTFVLQALGEKEARSKAVEHARNVCENVAHKHYWNKNSFHTVRAETPVRFPIEVKTED